MSDLIAPLPIDLRGQYEAQRRIIDAAECARLLPRIEQRDPDAEEWLARQIYSRWRYWFMARMGADAEEAMAELYLAVQARVQERAVHKPGAFWGYVATIAHRIVCAHYDQRRRAAARYVPIDMEPGQRDPRPDPEEALLEKEREALLHAAREALSGMHRDIVELLHQDCTQTEILQRLGLTPAQFRNAKYRALVEMRRWLWYRSRGTFGRAA